jgi:hypothetical protein
MKKSRERSRDLSLDCNGAKNSMDLSFHSSSLTIKAENHHNEIWQIQLLRDRTVTKARQMEGPLKLVAQQSPHPVWAPLFRSSPQPPRSNNFPESQVEASSSTSQPTNKCASCNALEADPEKPLKPCAKCQTVRYCSRDCQKKDFKVHKKICAAAAQIYAQNANLKPAAPRVPKKEGHRGGLQKWQFDT